MAAIVSFLGRYKFPLALLALSIFFQLVVIPSAFPTSHYDVLGVKRFGSIEEISEAYEKLSSKWNSSGEVPRKSDFVKIRYAFELLSNPLWKRDYDIFGIDEHLNVLDKVKEQLKLEDFSKLKLPLLNASATEPGDYINDTLTAEDFQSAVESNKTLIIQVFSTGSAQCAKFSSNWKRIGILLDGVASTGSVELGEVHLAAYLADRRSTGQPFFRTGLPAIVASPPGCRSSDCLVSYNGELSVDAVVDWIATNLLGFPRILYYSKETLVPKFIAKSGHHKVKVIYFSKTGERAAPFLRQAAKDYWAYASFALVLWQEEESSIWWSMFEVESAPAIVFLKDPSLKPVVYHGTANSSWFINIMVQNKHQELPQLRSVTSMDLGCDARGYSRAGENTAIWYCVILAGRPSIELSKMRETIRRVQGILLSDDVVTNVDEARTLPSMAAHALKEKRLTFTWLDGEVQKQYCFFYVHSEDSYETCGQRRYGDVDSPQLLIIRYKRNATTDVTEIDKRPKSRWASIYEEDENLASQLVARYNGSVEIPEIIQWISQIVKDGDSRDLPFFTAKSPELVPEDAEPVWSKGAQGILSKGKGMKQRIRSFAADMQERLRDPRIGPTLLLAACILFGSTYMSSRSTQPKEQKMARTRGSNRSVTNSTNPDHDPPSSITDDEPKDAYQLISSGSDTD